MQSSIRKLATACTRHPRIVLTAVTLLLLTLVAAGRFQPINLYYQATFINPLPSGTSVTFAFDSNPTYPGSSTQRASINGSEAGIHVDPLNMTSDSLRIRVSDSQAEMVAFTAHVSVIGHMDYTTSTIGRSELTSSKNHKSVMFALCQTQIAQIERNAWILSEIKLFLLIGIAVIYVAILSRMTIARKIARPYFLAIILGFLALVFFVTDLFFSQGHPANSNFPYKKVIVGIIIVFAVLLLINHRMGVGGNAKRKTGTIVANYVIVGLYAIAQIPLYIHYLGGFADEPAHMSYIAFLVDHGGVIPNFADMRIYSYSNGIMDMTSGSKFNYLGHPPLYYQLMRLFGGMQVSGSTVTFNMIWLRLVSIAIGVTAIGVLFYLGATRIPRIPLLHLLYALVIVSPPNLMYGIGGISNDTLALLTVSITLVGLIRFSERRYDWLTYALIAVGISGSLLTKLTAGLLAGLMAILFLAYTIVTESSAKSIINRPFLCTSPLYLLPIAYFTAVYVRFQTIQPSYQKLAYKEYITSGFYTPNNQRTTISVMGYIQYFLTQFASTWYSIAGHITIPRGDITATSLSTIGIVMILVSPIILFALQRGRLHALLVSGTISLIIIVLMQAHAAMSGFFSNGYRGGFSSRYYLCMIGCFGITIVYCLAQSESITINEVAMNDTSTIMDKKNRRRLQNLQSTFNICWEFADHRFLFSTHY